MTEDELNLLSEKVIGCSYLVSNALGSGFLEKVYENALAHELRKLGFKVEVQKPLYVIYDDVVVGEYFADLLVQDALIVEIKTSNGFSDNRKAQCINYLNATKLPLCLLINFGRPRIEIKRIFQSQFLENLS
ncbi:MAG TPA: GxxExxY protein [Pyrinomonadaceae bacterium]|nr:GxxExxY protein [Pyrinomonadaceae bacterium]